MESFFELASTGVGLLASERHKEEREREQIMRERAFETMEEEKEQNLEVMRERRKLRARRALKTT